MMKRDEINAQEELSPKWGGGGVIVLDDERPILRLVPAVLRHENLDVYPTASETEAWKLLGYPEISILIQDFNRGPKAAGGLAFAKRMLECPVRGNKLLVIHSGAGRSRIFGAFEQSVDIPASEIFHYMEKPALFQRWQELAEIIKAFVDAS